MRLYFSKFMKFTQLFMWMYYTNMFTLLIYCYCLDNELLHKAGNQCAKTWAFYKIAPNSFRDFIMFLNSFRCSLKMLKKVLYLFGI